MKIALKQIHPNPLQPRGKKPEVAQLMKSMAEVGLVQPIVVAKDGTGYVVIAGHCRWTAAVKLGWPDIECVVVETTDPKLDIGRIMAENEARTDLSGKERALGYETMIQLGWSDIAISAASGAGVGDIKAARAIAAVPKKAIAKMPSQASLPELAILVEFEEDSRALDELSRSLGQNNFIHVATRLRQQKIEQEKIDAGIKKITSSGDRYIPRDKTYEGVARLSHSKINQTVAEHSKCPGHCATVNYGGSVEYMCDKPEEHGITPMKPAAKDLALDKRKRQMRVLWRASAPVRQEFVKTQLAAGVKLSTDMMKFALTWVNAIGCPPFAGHGVKGLEYTKATALDTRFAATCVAQAESAIFDWVKISGAISDPGYKGCICAYLRTLVALGYPISDHEKATMEGTDYKIPEEPITLKPGAKILEPKKEETVPQPGPGQTSIPVKKAPVKKKASDKPT